MPTPCESVAVAVKCLKADTERKHKEWYDGRNAVREGRAAAAWLVERIRENAYDVNAREWGRC